MSTARPANHPDPAMAFNLPDGKTQTRVKQALLPGHDLYSGQTGTRVAISYPAPVSNAKTNCLNHLTSPILGE
jgi:hypothetical protein